MADRILVIAPHADDEVVGCGGMIARRALEGHHVHVVIAAIGGLKHRHLEIAASTEQRKQELATAAGILGVSRVTILFEGMDMRMDTVPQLDIVSRLDEILDEQYYDEVYFPYASHNHDHQELFRATFAAMRMTTGRRLPRLSALYEYAFVGWTPGEIQGGKMYLDIAAHLDTKVQAFEAYESQIRPFPHPCSPEAIRVLAAMRGVESGCAASELFYLQKMVV
ncbi:MAG: PIG-L family deacetylase [Chloroflexi bacterium]|nr:PIG-L family deacetylase [Chloroflexota bacterium]